MAQKTSSESDFFVCHCCKKKKERNKRIKVQKFCSTPKCQKARKAEWQKNKIKTDPEYRQDQNSSCRKWRKNNPEYYQKYRKLNPAKAEKNRILQKLRRKGIRISDDAQVNSVAKMDTLKPRSINIDGLCWMIPVAKMDAFKVLIAHVSRQ